MREKNGRITIFITSFHGLLSRILGSGVLDELLKNKYVNVVLFVLDIKKKYYEEKFGSDRVKIETVSLNNSPKKSKFFQKVAFFLLSTDTTKIQRCSSLKKNKEYFTFVFNSVLSFLGRFKIVRGFFRLSYFYFSTPNFFFHQFDIYRPNLVFSMDCKNLSDSQMLFEAKKRGIKTVGMVRSWDNLTAKGILRILPDFFIVHNEITKEEVVKYADFSPQNIYVSGSPQHDFFINFKRTGREEFFKKIGVDIGKRVILFAPTGSHYSETDWQILKIMKDFIASGVIPSDIHFIVRFPPSDNVELNSFEPDNNFSYDFINSSELGEEKVNKKNNEMTVAESLHLADLIFHSEIVIAGPSTILIDGIAMDKPAIAIGFDGFEEKEYYLSIIRYYDYCHMSKLLSSSAVKLARNKNDLAKFINEYLNDPTLDKEYRKKAVSEQCFVVDGKSSERVAKCVLSKIE